MSRLLNRVFVPKGKKIISEGDIAQKAFFIESGKLEVYRTNDKGEDQRLSLVGAGEIVGEFAFFAEGQKRTANVRTFEDSTVISLTLSDIQRYMEGMDKPARALFKILLDRLKRANDQLVEKYSTPTHVNEVCRIACKTIENKITTTESREQFQDTVRPVLNALIEAMSDFERKQKG